MAPNLPLHSLWQTLGAEFEIHEGWNLPVQFRDPEEEYWAAKNSIGLADLSCAGKIRVSGQDAKTLLHSILTQDIQNLKENQAALAALLNAQGKTLMLMEVILPSLSPLALDRSPLPLPGGEGKDEGAFFLIVEPNLTAKTIALLEKFIITEDVTLEDQTNFYVLFELYGPQAEVLMREFFGTGFFYRIQPFAWRWLIPAAEAQATVQHLLQGGKNIQCLGQRAYEMLRIESGRLRYGVDLDKQVILSESGLDSLAVNETKGCYPGQEVIARIKTYDGLHRKLYRIFFQEGKCPAAGTALWEGPTQKQAGFMTSCAFLPSERRFGGFAYLPKKIEKGAEFYFSDGGKRIEIKRLK